MNNIIVVWVVNISMAIISIILLSGKGAFLIAGYNTSSKEKKAQYDEKKLCRMMGCSMSVITLIMVTATFYNFEMPTFISWLIPWGIFAVVIAMMILMNTICKVKTQKTKS